MPACDAWMVQVPAPTSVAIAPDTVQTDEVSDMKLTCKPEDAVAMIVNGAVPKARLGGALKLMV